LPCKGPGRVLQHAWPGPPDLLTDDYVFTFRSHHDSIQ